MARTTVDGQEWRVIAGKDPTTGEFCSGQEEGVPGTPMGVGGSSSCGSQPLAGGTVFEVYPGQHVMPRRPTDPAHPKSVVEGGKAQMIYGEVAKSVAVMRLELKDGRTIDVAVSGSEAGLPVNFYAITVPPDGDPKAVIALDAQERELARKDEPLWGPFPPPPCLPPDNAQHCAPVTDVGGATGFSPPPRDPPPAPAVPSGSGSATAREWREPPSEPPG